MNKTEFLNKLRSIETRLCELNTELSELHDDYEVDGELEESICQDFEDDEDLSEQTTDAITDAMRCLENGLGFSIIDKVQYIIDIIEDGVENADENQDPYYWCH